MVMAAIVIVIISNGIPKIPIIPRIEVDAIIFGAIPNRLNEFSAICGIKSGYRTY